MASRLGVRLHDILDNTALIEGAIKGKSYDQFLADPILRLAIERAIEIISEASRHIPSDMTDRYPAIPWRNIRDIGNVLRHNYQRVDADIAWKIASGQLAELTPVIATLLTECESAT
jgi:uncharacterized protein with HEPN domain